MLNITENLARALDKKYWINGFKTRAEVNKNKEKYNWFIDGKIDTNKLNPDPVYGYPIVKNPSYCAANYILFAACVTLGNGTKVIMCDNIFDKLSEHTKQFIIYHEIGHIINNDHEKIKNQIEYVVKRTLCISDITNIELAADRYAIEHVGKHNALLALMEMMDVAGFVVNVNKEFKKRIEQCL